jgi:hypothetical protein
VPAEVIVIVEYEYFLVGSCLISVQMGGSEPGDTTADDNEIVRRIGLLDGISKFRAGDRHRMSDFE